MPEFFIEIQQEEIPSRMQLEASDQLEKRFLEQLSSLGISVSYVKSYVTPRRLVLYIKDLPRQQPDVVEEKKGPLLSAPEKAIEGFLKSVGLNSVKDCARLDTPKGEALFYQSSKTGVATKELLPLIIENVMNGFSWKKSMRFADQDFRWVRPLVQILAVFDEEALQGSIQLAGKSYPLATKGLGLYSNEDCEMLEVHDFHAYQQALIERGIEICPHARAEQIQSSLSKFAQEHDIECIEDQALVYEVAGLVERVKVLMGVIDQRFMKLPEAVLRLTIRTHQKYFLFRKNGKIAPYFGIVTPNVNSEAEEFIIAGNQCVLRARLQDAEFFLKQDQRISLEKHAEKLQELRFAEGLGSMADKCQRMQKILENTNLEPDSYAGLSYLAKADLVCEMVGEFPELQGMIGGYYAADQGHSNDVVLAITEHYSPKGPLDSLPTNRLGSLLAVSDKLDSLAGFASKDQLPKGSGDPFALRRAMLGIIRILVEQKMMGTLSGLIDVALNNFQATEQQKASLITFLEGRLGQYLKDQGVETAIAWAAIDSGLAECVPTALAMQEIMQTPQGDALRQMYIRAEGILKQANFQDHQARKLQDSAEPCEIALQQSLQQIETELQQQFRLSAKDKFAILVQLSSPLSVFFDELMVLSEDKNLQYQRLTLLYRVQKLLLTFANFQRLISG